MLCYVVMCYVMLYYVVLCYVMLCCVVLVMLCHVIDKVTGGSETTKETQHYFAVIIL